MCRLCKGQGWDFVAHAVHASQTQQCTACKGQGFIIPEDVDPWLFVDLDEPLGPGAMGATRPTPPAVSKLAEWHTWMDDDDGRGYLWAELRVPEPAGKGDKRKK